LLSNKSHDEFETLHGYVIFESNAEKDKATKHHNDFLSFNFLNFICCRRLKDVMPKEVLFKKEFPLRLFAAEEPSDIKWENLDISGWENFVRRFCGGVGIFVVMLLTIAMNVIGMSVVGTTTSTDTCQDSSQYTSD
jgi:hypothetical protein